MAGIALLLFAAYASAQQPAVRSPDPATAQVENYSLEANSFIEALLKISAQFRLPLGVEWTKTPDTLRPIRLAQSRTTVAEILDSIVIMQPGYEWRAEAGVIHVFERHLEIDNRNPLNITIRSFEKRPQTVGFANAVLEQRVRYPEQEGIAVSVLGSPDEPVFSFAARNTPARNLLDQMITSGLDMLPQPPGMNRIWIATFPENPVFTQDSYLKPLPVENPAFVPEESQPVWILLRWGIPPPDKMFR